MHAIISVLLFPPRESCRIRVSYVWSDPHETADGVSEVHVSNNQQVPTKKVGYNRNSDWCMVTVLSPGRCGRGRAATDGWRRQVR